MQWVILALVFVWATDMSTREVIFAVRASIFVCLCKQMHYAGSLVSFQDVTMHTVSMWERTLMCTHWRRCQSKLLSASLRPCREMPCACLSALLASCLSSSRTCCKRLTNCHETVPSTPVTDVSAGWLLMKISWKTSIGLSSGGLPMIHYACIYARGHWIHIISQHRSH